MLTLMAILTVWLPYRFCFVVKPTEEEEEGDFARKETLLDEVLPPPYAGDFEDTLHRKSTLQRPSQMAGAGDELGFGIDWVSVCDRATFI